MLDRSRPHSRSPRDLRPGPTDASTGHYWLMRRDLALPRRPVTLPDTLHEAPFNADNAAAVHRLLTLGTFLSINSFCVLTEGLFKVFFCFSYLIKIIGLKCIFYYLDFFVEYFFFRI